MIGVAFGIGWVVLAFVVILVAQLLIPLRSIAWLVTLAAAVVGLAASLGVLL